MSYPLCVVTYSRGRDHITGVEKPYHWAFLIETGNPGSGIGIAHQLSGMPGAFSYPSPQRVDVYKSRSTKERLEIGAIPSRSVERVRTILNQVPIDNNEWTDWNCQSWCKEGIPLLQREGWINEDVTVAGLAYWLRENQ